MLFLPPYSPDLNPIERDVANLKKLQSLALPNTPLETIGSPVIGLGNTGHCSHLGRGPVPPSGQRRRGASQKNAEAVARFPDWLRRAVGALTQTAHARQWQKQR